jgi:hypothetical protein
MKHRRSTWLLFAFAGLIAPPTALAQPGRSRSPGFAPPATVLAPQPSHLPLAEDPNVAGMADQLLNQRLNLAREAHELEKVSDLLQRLTQDPEFLKALNDLSPDQKKQLAKLSRDWVQGKNPAENPAWQELLKGLRSQEGGLERVLKDTLSGNDADILKRWAEKQPEPGKLTEGAGNGPSVLPPDPIRPPEGSNDPPATGPLGQPAPLPPPDPSLWQRLEQKSTSWFKDHVNDWAQDMGEWADSPLGNSLKNALRRAGQHASPEGASFDLSDKTRGLANTLGKVGEYLPTDRLRSLNLAGRLRNVHLPSLPSGGMSAPSLGPLSRASGGGALPGLLWALVLLTLGAVLWKSLRWYREQAAKGDGWKLGPWPVRPEAVATRDQLVSAFEYLALLCLGPVALACNHLDLAARLGAREGADVEKSRAAEHLARLYEQARYAPADEALPPDELAAARRDLCLLAGVAAA